MATTLIVNPGSTSRKYALYENGRCIFTLFFEETGTGFLCATVRNSVKTGEEIISASHFNNAFSKTVAYALSQKDIALAGDITHVGIRVVAPGSYFTAHRTINKEYIQKLKEVESVVPLHIPSLLAEIEACQHIVPDAVCVGVSDSAFHTTIPAHISTISIMQKDAAEFDIKRFGYHGLSLSSISGRLETQFGEIPKRVIVCHIGGGVSVTALKDGVSLATSMGYSPASGMLMGSRGGDIDGDVVAALTVRKHLKGEKLYEYLYSNAGFQGVAGVRDLRLVLERAQSGDLDAQLALDMFVYQIQSLIGAYSVLLGGLDAIVLTATASVRNPHVRSLVLSNLDSLGVILDTEKNEILIGKEGCIHTAESSVKIAVMKTDEISEVDRVVGEYSQNS